MSDSPTLSTAPFEHPALDYAFLRREGIRHLESLVGHLWTDFNTHDPGITILEQLCFAMTDLAYRASHDVADLLASSGGDPQRSLYSARTILTSQPVTILDLRKLVIDVDGVKNAWIEPILEPRPALHFHQDKRELRLLPDLPFTTQVRLQGQLRVQIETSDLVDRSTALVARDVARALHAARPLCTGFEEIEVLAAQPVQIRAEVEIGPVDDTERVLLDIYEALSEHVSPTVPFRTLGEMLAAGKRSDEIFDGPALDHGFLDSSALAGLSRRDAIHTSDLIREIMGIAGVRAVRSIAVSAGNDEREPWSLPLDPKRAPRLDVEGSSITLTKGRLTARMDGPRIVDALAARRRLAASLRTPSAGDKDFPPLVGKDRNVADYRSIQHDLPVIYGVGPGGLSDSESPRRRAQARQLKAYLLFFDQLLASSFAQLAHAGSLFSFFEEGTRTYFTRMVEDDALDLDTVRQKAPEAHRARLDAITEDAGGGVSASNRTNRFYNHLMARFAEQFTDYSLVLFGAEAGQAGGDGERLVPDKRAFLQRYPRISGARGTGADTLAKEGSRASSGLAERIQRKLGLQDEERFLMIEHLLLAPLREDDIPVGKLEYKQIPLLADAAFGDPYSLQLSFVLPGSRGRLAEQPGAVNELRLFVEHTIREETPAHLTPYVRWLSAKEWPAFEEAYADWREAYRAHRAARLGLGPAPDPAAFRARATRDRLIDLLAFGETYPLRDLPIRDEHLTVPYNQPARVPIDFTQEDVEYELRRDGELVLSPVRGNGGTIFLVTPKVVDDITYDVLARKRTTGREAYLQQQATVKVGLDTGLHARILGAKPLDPSIETPADEDARVVAWGTAVSVQVDHSQEGVDYHLVEVVGGVEKPLSPDVRGNLGDIVLVAKPATEDTVLQICATKVFDPQNPGATEKKLLVTKLRLAVRARRDLAVTVQPSAILAFGDAAAVRIDGTQVTAEYSLYVRQVPDRDYVFGPAGPGVVGADVPGEPRVNVLRPPQRPLWEDLEGFVPVGTAVQGNGGAVSLPAGALREDSVIVVRGRKVHHFDALAEPALEALTAPSSVQLESAALALVRPDPQPKLVLGVVVDGTKTTGTLEVSGGQPGVFYHARLAADGANLGLPAYFHKADGLVPPTNKGLEQLRIEVDLAISRGPVKTATTRAELGATPPLSPLLETGPLDVTATLFFRAYKAQTRVPVALAQTALLAAAPVIDAQPAAVAAGATAKIVVHASVVGDRYQLARSGQALGAPLDGTGADLAFTTPPLAQETVFDVVVTRPAAPGLPVRRTVRVRVKIAA